VRWTVHCWIKSWTWVCLYQQWEIQSLCLVTLSKSVWL
jgi:hypothetical protein